MAQGLDVEAVVNTLGTDMAMQNARTSAELAIKKVELAQAYERIAELEKQIEAAEGEGEAPPDVAPAPAPPVPEQPEPDKSAKPAKAGPRAA